MMKLLNSIFVLLFLSLFSTIIILVSSVDAFVVNYGSWTNNIAGNRVFKLFDSPNEHDFTDQSSQMK